MTLYLSQLTNSRSELLVSVVRAALGERLNVSNPATAEFEELNRLNDLFKSKKVQSLSVEEAKFCFDALHRTLYGLGPFELHTLTGHSLREFASAGLLLADVVYGGVYDGVLWTEEEYL